MVRKTVLAALALLAVAAPAAGAAAPDPCPGDPIAPDRVVTGEFGSDLLKSYVFVPFDVPAGTTAVRVKYCYDQPEVSSQGHTLDLGLYQPRGVTEAPWGPDQFRGWGGSSHPDVTVSAEGFGPRAESDARPPYVPGKTTRAFRPGPILPGEWAVELGVAAVDAAGDSDGKVAWRVEIDLSDDPAFADEPYLPARYSKKAVKRARGWYAGDLHVHAEHSALGDATMSEVFRYAFGPRPDGAGLDFVTLTDYVSGAQWGEIGRFQPQYPDNLIVRSAEIITYRGHLNSHANSTNMDYRTGPLYERAEDGTLTEVRPAIPPTLTFDRIHSVGGFAQINHPTIFPPTPAGTTPCRGCFWEYSDDETDYRKVDTYEVHTGPAGFGDPPVGNPFTVTAIRRWDELRADGHRITGVAVSDSHNAGETPGGITQSPIGQGTTVVYADELSEEGIQRALELGHAFVKLWASDDPDLRLNAVTKGGVKAMMGDPLAATTATFTARVLNGTKGGQERQLVVLRNGNEMARRDVTSDDFRYRFTAGRAGDYRIQLERGNAIDGLTNPITLGAKPLRIRAAVRPRRTRVGRRTRFVFDVRRRAQDRETPLAGATVRFAGKRARTNAAGRAVIRVRIANPGRYRATVTNPGLKRVRPVVAVRRG